MKQLSRRSFLATTAGAAVLPAMAGISRAGEVDIVVVGAGAAGIAAARKITAAGRRVAVFEAADRVGGRCVTDTRIFGVPFDLGAHWIHTPETNPLSRLAGRSGLDIYPAPPGQKLRIGKRNAREGEMEVLLAAVVRAKRAIDDAARGKTEISCAQALPKDLGEWRPPVEFLLGPFGCSKDLSDVSSIDFSRAADRDTGAFCRQGLGALLAKLADGLPIELASPVTRIESGGRLQIQTTKGRIGAWAVIVTASTNVLSSGKIQFAPELPKRQLDALSRLGLGSYDRVALEMPGNPLGLQRDDLVFEKAENARTAAMLANVAGSNLVFVDVAGSLGRELSAKGKGEMTAFALEWIDRLFGADAKKAVKRSHATQWGLAPYVLGASSVASVGGQPSRRIMMETLRDRIFFAGEAVHDTAWGTIGGAWESGERAADAALRLFGIGVVPRQQRQQR